ncbi:DUF1080 domain-containing protein [uncultured Sphingomonas sp.]|uniref:3-keto-disaccharide hydrolase n=1 Tax=uncultured Sphingomonas sp. TaxID=158754 RepID=UPI002633F623|nr:DUF1080 domain-containing protein [uncultured Sphingomonas sp.]
MTPRTFRKRCLRAIAMTAAIAAALPAAAQAADAPAPVPAGFTSLFDGKTLNGWRGDPNVWSVRDGAITASSAEGLKYNTFLILDKPYTDFEIRFKYRFATAQGNSGLQIRSGQTDGNYVLGGMQANIIPANFTDCGLPSCGEERFGMLYEELNRLELVLLGQKATITRRQSKTGGPGQVVRTITGTTNSRADIIKAVKPYPEWNEDIVIAHGNRIIHIINGYVAFDATDNDPLRTMSGLIGIQAHAGPPSTMQFKDFVIKPLTAMPDIASRFISKPETAAEPERVYRTIELKTEAGPYVAP